MDDTKNHQIIDEIDDDHHGMFNYNKDFLGFTNLSSTKYVNMMKFILLLGAEKMLMSRKPSAKFAFSNSNSWQDNEDIIISEEKEECEADNGYLDVSKTANYTPGGFDESPFNIGVLFAMVVLKLAGFQIGLVLKFFTVSIWLFNFWLTFIFFPFQSLIKIKDHFKKKLLQIWGTLWLNLNVVSFICNRITRRKSLLSLAVRFSKALLCSIYVCSILLGLLISGFIISYLSMKQILEEPIKTSKTLNFDYTKASPVAFVPITSSLFPGVSPSLIANNKLSTAEHAGTRFIPYNHKLRLTVSLTLPESEYNRKLGIFQVRVESLSTDGKLIATSSYPTMLRFKSNTIHFAETIFKTIPRIAGFQPEVQNLKLKITDFTEGLEPTACFKVILEQRAEFQNGAGIPETYAAELDIESELPQIKSVIWNWRKTIFIWISIFIFLFEVLFVFIFCKPLVLPSGRQGVVAGKISSSHNKISW